MTNKEFFILLNGWHEGSLSAQQLNDLHRALISGQHDNMLNEVVETHLEAGDLSGIVKMESKEQLLKRLLSVTEQGDQKNVHQISRRVKALYRYAAAIILILTGLAFYFIFFHKPQTATTAANTVTPQVAGDISPGFKRAVLTLSNGQKVELDSAASQTIKDGDLSIQNNQGQLSYLDSRSASGEDDSKSTNVALMNTMATPKGGQYILTLADGTRVWLNAASSITYPIKFTGKTREISVTGEVYLEVNKNKTMPFIVDIGGKAQVEVLGTSFNINSYENESNTRATLIEGSIKVRAKESEITIKPGEQARINKNNIEILSGVNIEQIVAWKNGLFDFNGLDLRGIMRQLERWYDIDVEYQAGIDTTKFNGEMYRNVNLADVLEMLGEMGIRYKLDGRKLTIIK